MKAIAVLLLVLAASTAGGQPPAQTAPYQVVETVVLPKGDARAGRQAFQELKCHVCHAVSGEKDFSPIAELRGPMLNATLQLQTSSDVAAAILAPSHSLSVRTSEAVKAQMWRQGASPMGDYSEVLTVRQLADLLAYLRSIR
jgi:mono/diheme cytochrome c family protein